LFARKVATDEINTIKTWLSPLAVLCHADHCYSNSLSVYKIFVLQTAVSSPQNPVSYASAFTLSFCLVLSFNNNSFVIETQTETWSPVEKFERGASCVF
jgi:hypothetical protein